MLIDMTLEPDYLRMTDFEARGIPYGRAAEVALRNNHAQYIFTWYGCFQHRIPSYTPNSCQAHLTDPS